MSRNIFDIVVIGAGPGGYVAPEQDHPLVARLDRKSTPAWPVI